jgi:hypothetical protein
MPALDFVLDLRNCLSDMGSRERVREFGTERHQNLVGAEVDRENEIGALHAGLILGDGEDRPTHAASGRFASRRHLLSVADINATTAMPTDPQPRSTL